MIEYVEIGKRFAVISFDDIILFDSDSAEDCLTIYEIWCDYAKGVYDYAECRYITD